MTQILSNIKKLEEKRRQGAPKYKFNGRLDIEIIETFEKAHGIVFPESYKKFMAGFNGGMILEYEESFYIDMTDWEPDGPKWSSYYFHTLDELSNEYSDLKYECKLISNEVKDFFPLIPICNTPKQETIMLVSQKGLAKESPVFISPDISDMSTYVQIFDDFDSFLAEIIEYNGFPDIKAKPGSQLLSMFIYNSGILKETLREETNDEIIDRTTAYLNLYPKRSWSYYERGNAYKQLGKRKLALADFNKSIEQNDKEGLFYYCRGNLILDYGSKRKALIDLDIAVKLDPENHLFLSGRADALQKLGKLDKALCDCNKVLNEDGIYKLALYVRERVYRSMGEDELAQADSELIDDIDR